MALYKPWSPTNRACSPPCGNGRIVSRAQKHALVTRRCKCGRKIADNVYFKHVKHCRPVEERPLGKAV